MIDKLIIEIYTLASSFCTMQVIQDLRILKFCKWALHFSDNAEDYDQNDFSYVNQNNDQDNEMDVDCKHQYIIKRVKTNTILNIFSDQ